MDYPMGAKPSLSGLWGLTPKTPSSPRDCAKQTEGPFLPGQVGGLAKQDCEDPLGRAWPGNQDRSGSWGAPELSRVGGVQGPAGSWEW